MNTLIVTLVVTMVIGGRDFERNERMSSLEECWETARARMETLRNVELEDGHGKLTKIGVGCVVDAGDPA